MLEMLDSRYLLIYFQQTQKSYCISSFLFLFISNTFFILPVVKENTRVNPALSIPAGTPRTPLKIIIDIPPLVANKTIKP